MKSLIAAASAAAAVAIAAPAFAQTSAMAPVTGYVDLGYSYADTAITGLGTGGLNVLDGRIGAKFGRYIGAEGELGFGVGSKTIGGADVKLRSTYAGYAVGHLPLSPQAELFARVGYGHSSIRASSAGLGGSVTTGTDSWNFGGGAEYFLTPHDGLRAEYTREDFRHDNGHANVFAISYVRRFR